MLTGRKGSMFHVHLPKLEIEIAQGPKTKESPFCL